MSWNLNYYLLIKKTNVAPTQTLTMAIKLLMHTLFFFTPIPPHFLKTIYKNPLISMQTSRSQSHLYFDQHEINLEDLIVHLNQYAFKTVLDSIQTKINRHIKTVTKQKNSIQWTDVIQKNVKGRPCLLR